MANRIDLVLGWSCAIDISTGSIPGAAGGQPSTVHELAAGLLEPAGEIVDTATEVLDEGAEKPAIHGPGEVTVYGQLSLRHGSLSIRRAEGRALLEGA